MHFGRSLVLAAALAAILLTLPEPARAQDPEPGPSTAGQAAQQEPRQRVEERITVTADRIPLSVDAVGSAVTVLEEPEIRATQARWMPELLAGLPGVVTAANGGPGGVASLFVRGTNSNHTLVLVDGLKVNSPTTGGTDFSKLAVANVERVEVVRGPQGALYGSQALGGVIQIFTRRPSGALRVDLGADAGAFGTRSGRAWLGAAHDTLDWGLGLHAFTSDGISAADADRGATEEDGYDSVTGDARVGTRVAERWRLEAFGRAFNARTDIDGFAFPFGPADDPNAVTDTRELYAGGRARYESPGLRSVLTLGDTEQWAETNDPDASFTLASELRASIRELDWQNELRRGDHTLLAGVELRRESGRIDSTTVFGASGFDEGIDTGGVYLHDRAVLGERVHVMAGGRWERHSRYGDDFTFRVAGMAALTETLSLHASAGSGFRAPSLNDLFFPIFSNPDLEPERSLGLDAGLRWAPVDLGLRLDVTAFHIDVEDLVFFAGLRPENLGAVRTRGLEATASWRSEAVGIAAVYTLTDAVDRQTDVRLFRRPRHSGSLRATVSPTSRLALLSELRLASARDDLGPLGTVTLDPYALWNAAATLELTPRLGLRLRVENLLDEDYEEVFGYGTLGRSAYVGLHLGVGGGG